MRTEERKREEGKVEFKYPGIPSVVDGTTMAVWVEAHICDGACAYPITPASDMGEGFQRAVADGMKNLWGEELFFFEPESEHSAASVCEGFAAAGGRVANFTAGQGLILMKEVLYTIAGKRLPAVFHISARPLTVHSLNVHCGHDDVMGVSDTGWGILMSRNVQEVGDLALIARKTSEESFTPFLVVQDGFLTSHTIERALLPEPEFMKEFVGNPREKIPQLLNPKSSLQIGVVQNQDSYMKGRIAQRFFTDNVKPILKKVFEEFYKFTGRRYDFVRKHKIEDADFVIVGMGTLTETAEVVADFLREKEGMKVGVLTVTSFRPFPGEEIVDALKNAKAIAVVERTDNPLAQSNPLTVEIKAAFSDAISGVPGYPLIKGIPKILHGSAGLGSRDISPSDFISTYKFLESVCSNGYKGNGSGDIRYFSLGIEHVQSLKRKEEVNLLPKGTFALRGHSVGGYGSITTNKVLATLISEAFGLYVQAYPKYGGEKKGLPTNYYLVVSPEQIKLHSELRYVDFVVLNDPNAMRYSNPLLGLKENGTIFMHSDKTEPQQVWQEIPSTFRQLIERKNIRVLYLDTVKIARETAPTPDLLQRMQGITLLGVFLRVSPYSSSMSEDELFEIVLRELKKFFGKRGEETVLSNLEAVKRSFKEMAEIDYKGGNFNV